MTDREEGIAAAPPVPAMMTGEDTQPVRLQRDGPRAIDKVRSGTNRAVRWLDVPEWDLRLGFTTMTPRDIQMVGRMDAAASPGGVAQDLDYYERTVRLVILKAMVEVAPGRLEPAFQSGDLSYLMDAENAVVMRVGKFMYGTMVTATEAKTAIEKTDASASS